MLLSFILGASLFLSGFFWQKMDLSLVMLPLLFVGFWLGLLLIAFLFLWIVSLCVNLKKPQEHDDKFYRSVMDLYIEALIGLVRVRLRVKGLEKTPKEGRFLLVCNHQSVADPGIVLRCFKSSQLAFISKQENSGLFIVNKMMHKTMCQLINRENDREALKTILKCIQLLKNDEVSVCVFPEGGIKEKGKLSHFRSGVFKIAQKANVPIVVCTLHNTTPILSNIKRLKPTDVELHLVDVIPAEDLKDRTTVDIADQVYRMMLEDLGESFRTEE